MMYTASVFDENNQIVIIDSEYPRKSDFIADIKRNGYKLRFVGKTNSFEAECEKYYAKHGKYNTLRK